MFLYKDHSIYCSGARDKNTGKYEPVASITWTTSEGNRAEHFLTSSERCHTQIYAVAVALDEAKLWIDRDLAKRLPQISRKRLRLTKTCNRRKS
jgi:hypothetical protein